MSFVPDAPSASPGGLPSALPAFAFDNSYARDLPGAYVAWQPAPAPQPSLVWLNRPLADELGLDADGLAAPGGVAVLAGNAVPEGAQPLAQAYAGHQFGGFSPQLGDGRALLLGEVIDRQGRRRDIAFKGSGRTPFSRGGDGKAALGPVLREVLVGEAMHALGIPTTRALAAVSTGEPVFRDRELPGAVLTRVAASHLRVGTFQYFAARQDAALLRQLVDHAVARHDPGLTAHERPALALLAAVAGRQATLVARWMGVGFIHGVMNTDNMTISGETIDYGPCAFMEAFDPQTFFSSIDTHGRYAWGNQPGIAQWNLARLAEALLPCIDESAERAVDLATAVIEDFPARYRSAWIAVLRAKLGLDDRAAEADDLALGEAYLGLLHDHAVDFTLGFAHLAAAAAGDERPLRALFGPAEGMLAPWLERWRTRQPLGAAMRRANPVVIARNHQVEAALEAAVERGDLAPFGKLLAVLRSPFELVDGADAYVQPAPVDQVAGYRTFCGT